MSDKKADDFTSPAALMALAREAAMNAHAPYSSFRVGAAVVAGGSVFAGCNVENASYGLAICAERNAIFAAVAAGHKTIDAVAVACIDAAPDAGPGALMPCGACRQVMAEFGHPALPVHVDGVGSLTLADLLPRPFFITRPQKPIDTAQLRVLNKTMSSQEEDAVDFVRKMRDNDRY